MTESFGALLCAYRIRRSGRVKGNRYGVAGHHLSQNAVAVAANLDPGHVNRLEKGTRNPTRACVLALARALTLTRTETDRLLAAAGFAPSEPPAEGGTSRWQTAPEPWPTDAERWAEFCRTIDERIARERLETPPLCAACEAVKPTTTRRCSPCGRTLPLVGNFSRDRSKPLGYRYVCKECMVAENKRSNLRRKRRVVREILGRSA